MKRRMALLVTCALCSLAVHAQVASPPNNLESVIEQMEAKWPKYPAALFMRL